MALMPVDETDGLSRWLLLERVMRQLAGENIGHTFGTWFSVSLLDKSANQSATKKEAQKLFNEQTKREHEIRKYAIACSTGLVSLIFIRLKTQLATLDNNVASLKEAQRLAKERMEKAQADTGTVDEKKLRESEVHPMSCHLTLRSWPRWQSKSRSSKITRKTSSKR